MSQARVHTVTKAAKDQGKCEHCGAPLPKGGPYRWYSVGFRSHYKHKRCMLPKCTPTQADRESSLLAEIYTAQESASATLDSLSQSDPTAPDDFVSQVRDAVTEVADAVDSVAQQYRDQDEAFGGSGSTEAAERADTLEGASGDLQGWDPDRDEPEACDDHDAWQDACDACADNWSAWVDDVVQQARDAIDGVELP